jgi:hypothetical protein
MPATKIRDTILDARPDRIDYRDRRYQPPLVSLPEQHPDPALVQQLLPRYAELLILNQGHEGACTGFGLAAVIITSCGGRA